MYPVPTQLICSITPILTIGYITFLRGNLGLDQAGLLAPPLLSASVDRSKPLAPRPPHFESQAKSIIWIMLNGGPGQMDTWDYKPELQKRDGEPLDGADKKTGFFLTSGKLLASPFRFS